MKHKGKMIYPIRNANRTTKTAIEGMSTVSGWLIMSLTLMEVEIPIFK